MEHNTRRLTGIVECACRNCAPSGSNWRAYVKRDTRRAIRHSKAREILQALHDDTDHNGDADYMVDVIKLTVENVRNLRTIR